MKADAVDDTATDDPVAQARGHLRWWRELLYVLVLYLVYSAVRNTFGSSGLSKGGDVSPVAVRHAYGHALDVVRIERALGLFVEPHVQRWYLDLPSHGFIRFWNIYYGTFHFVVPIAALVWLFVRHPDHYAKWRNVIVFTTLLALIGFAGYTLMPPRLLDATEPYGACNPLYGLRCHHYGFVDTLVLYKGLWSFGSGPMAHVSNQYAAMPSLHIGWSTWCALVIAPIVRRWWAKVLAWLYPVATLFCIIVTGNHYWLDAVGGLVTLAAGYLVGVTVTRLATDWSDRRATRRSTVGPAPRPPSPARP